MNKAASSLFMAQLLFKQLRPSMFGSFAVAISLALFVLNHNTQPQSVNTLVYVWLLVISTTLILRFIHSHFFLSLKMQSTHLVRCISIFRFGTLVTGLAWASVSFLFLPYMDMTANFLLIIIMMGLSTGAMNSLASDYISYALYISALLLPYSLKNVTSSHDELFLIGILSSVLLFFLLLIGRKLTTTISDSYQLRQQKEELIQKISQEKSSLNKQLRALFDDESHEIYLFDSESLKSIRVNKGAILNHSESLNSIYHELNLCQLIGKSASEINQLLAPLYQKSTKYSVYHGYFYRKDGSHYFAEARFQLLKGTNDKILYLSAFDASANEEQRQKSLEQDLIIKSILASSPMLLTRLSPKGDFLFIDTQSINLPSDFPIFKKGDNFFEIFNHFPNFIHFVQKAINGETALLDVPLGEHYFEFKIWPQYHNKQIESLMCIGVDITERKTFENQLFEKANFDSLTGLTNRAYFKDVLPPLLALAQREHSQVALIYIDLDNFKTINDTQGHEAGDQLLKTVATILRSSVRSSDIVCRLGGDEFIIAAHCKKSTQDIAHFVEKLRNNINSQLSQTKETAIVTASVGIAVYPQDGSNMESLIKKADSAMYASKDSGKNKIEFFNPQMEQEITTRHKMATLLRSAMDNQEFHLLYQPKVSARDSKIKGVEALIRWNNPTLGSVSPAEFIPIAEETGLITEIGNWVLKQSCIEISQFNRDHSQSLSVAVNFSPVQFLNEMLFTHISKALSQSTLPAQLLTVEVTESFLAKNIDSLRQKLDWLSTQGIQISLDDFGTGYSSLSYLNSLPFDVLKIDKSFVQQLSKDRKSEELVKAIIAMAKSLQLNIVAEGVETAQQLDFLQSRGVDIIQGYYFMPPVPLEQLPTDLILSDNESPEKPTLISFHNANRVNDSIK